MSPIVHLPPDVISLLLSALTEQNEYPSIPQASWICSSALNVCFSSLSDLVEDKVPVCPSVLVSCLLPSSSSRCVVSTSEKGGTKKKKKSLPLPKISSRSLSPSAPFVRPALGLWKSSHHSGQVVTMWQLTGERLCPGPCLLWAGGSLRWGGALQDLPRVWWLEECALVSVYLPFSYHGRRDEKCQQWTNLICPILNVGGKYGPKELFFKRWTVFLSLFPKRRRTRGWTSKARPLPRVPQSRQRVFNVKVMGMWM